MCGSEERKFQHQATSQRHCKQFLNSVEISAQEAVYIVVQLPMKKSSGQVVFINTAPPDEGVQLLKQLNEIKEMEDNCEQVYTTGLLQRYLKRSSALNT